MPNDGSCNYDGQDTRAAVGSNTDGSWHSRCNCGTTACVSGTYDEAIAALATHRAGG